ncbi:hypothetical protein BH23GEM4_BH23GEM4_15990 [soil metagenome]
MRATIPPDESERLEALAAYDVLDTLPERAYDDIIRLASAVCGTPVALITLIDGDRQWFKAAVGIDERETSRDIAFCAHAILHPDVLVVPDLREDERFADNPFVTGPHAFRFYAAAPLITPDGQALGTLCVVDHEPRELSAEQLDALRALANQTMAQLKLRRHVRELEAAAAERREAERLGDERLARIERDQAALMELVRIGDAHLDESLDRLLRTAAETLEVGRVSVWLLEAEGDEIVCRDLYLADEQRHESGLCVRREENPAYLRALSEERILAAHDAASDPRTRDFAESYLRPSGITSMLDAPIWRKGELVGVLCHEHVGPARRWSQEEQEFASTVADMETPAVAVSAGSL